MAQKLRSVDLLLLLEPILVDEQVLVKDYVLLTDR